MEIRENIMGLSHFGLYVENIDVSRAFYAETLGFNVCCETMLANGLRLCFLKKGDCEVELIERPGIARADGHFDHLSLRVQDINQAVSSLKAAGIAMESDVRFLPSVYDGVKNVMFRGPDNEHIELNEFV